MPRIAVIPREEWGEAMSRFGAHGLEGVETDLLGIQAHLPRTTEAFYKTRAILAKEGTLPPRLIELVRLRIAFFNQCRSCMAVRYSDEVTDGLVCSLERPEEAADLTDAEKSALRFAELLSTDHLSIDDAVYADLRTHFTETQLVELGTAAALYLGMGRLGATWHATDHVSDPLKADGVVGPWAGISG
jgi:alkylhydroperoxidase family enzyme